MNFSDSSDFSTFFDLPQIVARRGSALTSLTGYLPGFFFWVVSLFAKTKYLFHLIPKQRTSHQKSFEFDLQQLSVPLSLQPLANFTRGAPETHTDDLQTISKLRDPPRQEILSAPSKIFIREKSQSIAQISLIFALWNTNYLKICTKNFEMHKSTKIQLLASRKSSNFWLRAIPYFWRLEPPKPARASSTNPQNFWLRSCASFLSLLLAGAHRGHSQLWAFDFIFGQFCFIPSPGG